MRSFRIGFWAMLLAPCARTFQAMEWKGDQVQLKGWGAETALPYDHITDSVNVVPGLFWDRLVVPSNSQPLVLGGISKRQSIQLRNTANGLLSTYWATQFGLADSAIIECAHRWLLLTNHEHYFRHSQLTAWLESVRPLQHFVQHKHRSDYLSVNAGMAASTIEMALINSEAQRDSHNEQYTVSQLEKYKAYFDRVESKPLSIPQRRACVQHDDSNLVLAGAGTGKTSTMVGKAGYLIESGEAQPEEILMLAFGNKAAKEMEERVEMRLGLSTLKIKTFHSLGLEIIGMVEGKRPALSDLAEDDLKLDAYMEKTIGELKRDPSYRSTFIDYFLYCLLPSKTRFDFRSEKEYIAYCNQYEPRTLKGELVKSYEELAIANFLFRLGVQYTYEAEYEIDTATIERRRYKPDFFLTDYAIYLEHFALDKTGMPPRFMDQRRYLEGVQWKRDLHQKHQTRLLETFSYEQKDGVLLKNLEDKLKSAGVRFNPVPDDRLLDTINSIQEAKDFTRLLAELLKAFKRAGWRMAELVERAKNNIEQAGVSLMIKLFQPLYERYQAYLERNDTIDFEDMINRAIGYVRSGEFQSPYRFVLIDEFQDISGPRADLIKGLLGQRPDNSLFCVGDDWQAIYRFTGSDVSYTKRFSDHFGATAVNALDTTYRFNDKIGRASSRFVQTNPDQLRKTINSLRNVQQAAITLIPSRNTTTGLRTALTTIAQDAKPRATVLLLARFNFKLPDNLDQLKRIFPDLRLQAMSVHASKGKEADYVIVLGMDKGKFGFPSEKGTPPLLEMLLPAREGFAHAEERRLLYVALTRARHHVYLLSDPQNSSVFVRELRKYGREIVQLRSSDDAPGWSEDISCPVCETGYLIARNARSGSFFLCSNRPYCEHTESGCRQCGGYMRRSDNELVCQNLKCGAKLSLCPLCGGTLKERRGAWGVFWGCSNYRRNDPNSCRYTTRT